MCYCSGQFEIIQVVESNFGHIASQYLEIGSARDLISGPSNLSRTDQAHYVTNLASASPQDLASS